jgi:hypothetical protein
LNLHVFYLSLVRCFSQQAQFTRVNPAVNTLRKIIYAGKVRGYDTSRSTQALRNPGQYRQGV